MIENYVKKQYPTKNIHINCLLKVLFYVYLFIERANKQKSLKL